MGADIMTDSPIAVENGELTTLQSNQLRDATNPDNATSTTVGGLTGWVDEQGERIREDGEYIEFDVSFGYAVDASDIGIASRGDVLGGGTVELDVTVDGDTFDQLPQDDGIRWWMNFSDLSSIGVNFSKAAGETITVRIDWIAGDGNLTADLVTLYDARYTYDFDNTTDTNFQLSGPELFPDSTQETFATAETQRNVTEANYTLTAPDVSGAFEIELSNDGGATYKSVSNATSGSVTFDSADSNVDTRVTLGRYGSRTADTPTSGYLGQSIDDWQLFANPDAVVPDDIGVALTRAIVPPNTSGVVGNTVREAGIKSDSTLLTRHELAEFEVLADQRLASSESTRFTGDE
jgi:hypothetical protein